MGGMRARTLLLCSIACLLTARATVAKSVEVADTWSLEVPSDWKIVDTSPRDRVEVYSFGVGPAPGRDHVPMMLANAGKGTTPEPIRGISFTIALEPLAYVAMPDTNPVDIEIAGHHVRAYRLDSKDHDFVSLGIPRWKGMPKPMLDPAPHLALLVTVGAKDEAELKAFLRVLDTLQAKTPGEEKPDTTAANSPHR